MFSIAKESIKMNQLLVKFKNLLVFTSDQNILDRYSEYTSKNHRTTESFTKKKIPDESNFSVYLNLKHFILMRQTIVAPLTFELPCPFVRF